MGIICRLWKYFADYGNTFQILGHRGGATLLGFDAMWMSCSALVLFIIIIIVILISIIVLIIVIYIALCVPHKQTSQCKDAWIRGLPATNSIPVKKRKSLESHKLSQSTTKSQIESRLRRVFPHLGLGDSHWVSPISGKGSSQIILGFF